MTWSSVTTVIFAVIAVTFAVLAIRQERRTRAAAREDAAARTERIRAAHQRYPTETLHIDGYLVDFSPTVLGEDGTPICTCTVSAKCLRCYEESL